MGNAVIVTRRTLLWVGGVIGALLVALIVLVGVLIGSMNAQADSERYQNCMARLGYAADAPVDLGGRTEDEWIDDIAGAAEYCAD